MNVPSIDNAAGILCTHDLMFYSQVTGMARTLGRNLIGVNSIDQLLQRMSATPTKTVFLDLMLPGFDAGRDVPSIRDHQTDGMAIIAYGPHVQVDRLKAAEEAGCDLVLPRSRFSSGLRELIERYVPQAL